MLRKYLGAEARTGLSFRRKASAQTLTTINLQGVIHAHSADDCGYRGSDCGRFADRRANRYEPDSVLSVVLAVVGPGQCAPLLRVPLAAPMHGKRARGWHHVL